MVKETELDRPIGIEYNPTYHIMQPQTFTIRQFAKRLGVSPGCVQNHIRRGHIKLVPRSVMGIPSTEVDRLRNSGLIDQALRQGGKRPPKKLQENPGT